MNESYLFSFETDVILDYRQRDERRLPLVLLLQLVQILAETLVSYLVLAHPHVHPPIRRIEPPMHSPVLQLAVDVTDELLRRKRPQTLRALDASRVFASVQFRGAKTPGFPETLVINGEPEGPLARPHVHRHLAVQQRAAEALRVRFGYESATGSTARQDALVLEHVQLFRSASRTVDLQTVALVVDLDQ